MRRRTAPGDRAAARTSTGAAPPDTPPPPTRPRARHDPQLHRRRGERSHCLLDPGHDTGTGRAAAGGAAHELDRVHNDGGDIGACLGARS